MLGPILQWVNKIYQKVNDIPVSPIKSVQRGEASSSGNISINSVNTSKAMVLSFSKGSSGHVAARGNLNMSPSNGSFTTTVTGAFAEAVDDNSVSFPSYSGDVSGGSTNLVVEEYGATLVDSTTINSTGPCAWQVIEYA